MQRVIAYNYNALVLCTTTYCHSLEAQYLSIEQWIKSPHILGKQYIFFDSAVEIRYGPSCGTILDYTTYTLVLFIYYSRDNVQVPFTTENHRAHRSEFTTDHSRGTAS